MTRAQAQEIAAALIDLKGWLRDVADAAIMLSIMLISGLTLLNVARVAWLT